MSIPNILIMKKLKFENFQMWHRHMKLANAIGNNDDDTLAQHKVATNLQLVKDAISEKHNKMRSACI